MPEDDGANGRRRIDWWICAGLALLAFVPFLPMLLRGHLPVLRDHSDYFIPMRWFTARALSAGSIPHWNPFNGLGEAWLANPQTGVLYPPTWLHVLLPFEIGYVSYLVLHLALLGIGTFLVCRALASRTAAVVSAVALMFSGPVLSLLDVSNNLASLAWLPWIVFISRMRADWLRRSLAGGLVLALCFLAAEPSFAAIGAALFVTLVLSREEGRAEKFRCISIAGLLAILLSGPQLFPFVLSLHGSDRTAGLDASALANSIGGADLVALITPFAQGWGGALRDSGGQQFLPSTYISVSMILLMAAGAVAALRSHRRWIIVILLISAVMLVASFVGSVGFLSATLGNLMTSIRHPARYFSVAVVLFAPLIALGLDSLRRRAPARWYVFWCFFFALALWRVATVPSYEGAIALALELALFALLLPRLHVSVAVRTGSLLVLIVALMLSNGRFAFRSGALESLVPDVPQMPPGSRLAVATPAGPKLAGTRSQRLPVGYLNLLAGAAKADTPAPVVPDRIVRYLGFAADAGVVPLLSMAAVSRAHTGAGQRDGWSEIPALPFVSGWNGVEAVENNEEALRRTLRNPQNYALYSPDRLPRIALTDRKPVRVGLQPSPSGWSLRVEAPAAVLLMISERAAPGWRVAVDGRNAEWGEVNGVFRAVAVDAGAHLVEWSYVTPGWKSGWVAFGVGLIVVLLLIFGRQRFLR